MSDSYEVTQRLLRFLGVDGHDVTRLMLVVRPGQYPVLRITKVLRDADGKMTAVNGEVARETTERLLKE